MSDVFPVPDMEQADWLCAVSKLEKPFSLRHYRAMGRAIKKGRLYTIEVGMRINEGLDNNTIAVEMITSDWDGVSARVNHYFMTDEAKLFWKTGMDSNQSPKEILQSWESYQSILGDVEKKEE